MNRQFSYIQQNKSALFDWLVFFISLSLGIAFPSLRDFISSHHFTNWMLAALLLYTIGTLLKHKPVYYRLIRSGKPIRKVPFLFFLLIGHWLIFLMVIIFSESSIRRIFHLPPIDSRKGSDGWIIFASITIATLITAIVFRSRRKIKNIDQLSSTALLRQEIVGEVFLIAAVSILSFVFWEKGILTLLTAKPTATIGDVWFMFVFLTICYILFYLPLRYLFLIEDYSNRKTWKRMLLIFGLLLLKSLFEMLKI